MAKHSFRVGQNVRLIHNAVDRKQGGSVAETVFQIVRLMPLAGSAFQYRLRDSYSGQERVVGEMDIRA
jgi:hypothetical protein